MNTEPRQQTVRHGKEAKSVPVDRRDFWDRRAQEFSAYAANTGYPLEFMRILQPRMKWTVLDMACGGGTITIPLAAKVKSITAVDFSKRMLDIVDWRCQMGGIDNVKTLHGRWEDDWDRLDIGVYDVAIASRSLIGDDVKSLIDKLNQAARKAVFISVAVGAGPFDKALFESTGRTFNMGQDYIHYYNLLYEMGIKANVAFIPERHRNHWDSHEEALADQRWMFHGMTEEEEDKVRAYLKQHLVSIMGRWHLPYSRQCHWAVMWWKKDKQINKL